MSAQRIPHLEDRPGLFLRCVFLWVLTLSLALPSLAQDDVVARRDSPYGKVFVVDVARSGERVLRFEAEKSADQSAIILKRPRYSPMDYVRALSAGIALPPLSERALIIGMGGGGLSNMLLLAHPSLRLQSVELNPLVVTLAREYFSLLEPGRHRVITGDGRAHVLSQGAQNERFDFIVLDAYAGDDIPESLATPAFFQKALALLNEGGVLGVNLAVEDDDEERLLYERLRSLPKRCRFVRTGTGNLVVFLGGGEQRPAQKRATMLDESKALEFSLLNELSEIKSCGAWHAQ